jgi:hypothetical protein
MGHNMRGSGGGGAVTDASIIVKAHRCATASAHLNDCCMLLLGSWVVQGQVLKGVGHAGQTLGSKHGRAGRGGCNQVILHTGE